MGFPLLYLEFGAATLAPSDHPNRMNFRGCLLLLDEPSTKPPNGAEGHKILVPSDVAKRRLNTLVGMGLNYAPDLAAHAQRRKVGTITKAYIKGNEVWVDGIVWKKDFPEAEKDLKQKGLGMSMELGDVDVQDQDAKVWTLKDFCFLGATILWKRSAAYSQTLAIAANAENGGKMATKKTTQELDASKIAELAANAVMKQVSPALNSVRTLAKAVGSLSAKFDALEMDLLARKDEDEDEDEDEDAAAVTAKKDEDEDAAAVTAGKKRADDDDDDDGDEDDEDEDDMDSTVDKGDLTDLGPTTGEDAEDNDTPGKFGSGVKNKGDKTTSEDKVGKTVSSAQYVKVLRANHELSQRVKKLEKQMSASRKQIAAASAQTDRRSQAVPIDTYVQSLCAKGGLDAREMQASGQKLTVDQVDAILKDVNLSVEQRMVFKNRFLEAGLMEQGYVNRSA